jgi:hypothetical protein
LSNSDVSALAINPKFPNSSIIYAGTSSSFFTSGGVFAAEFLDAPPPTGIYPQNGSTAVGTLADLKNTGITEHHDFVEVKPRRTELLPNYPNPFNPETWIPYRLSEEADVTVYIFDSRGQLIRTILVGRKSAGTYIGKSKAVHWDGKNDGGERIASGVYFYQLKAGRFSDTKKLAVMN